MRYRDLINPPSSNNNNLTKRNKFTRALKIHFENSINNLRILKRNFPNHNAHSNFYQSSLVNRRPRIGRLESTLAVIFLFDKSTNTETSGRGQKKLLSSFLSFQPTLG